MWAIERDRVTNAESTRVTFHSTVIQDLRSRYESNHRIRESKRQFAHLNVTWVLGSRFFSNFHCTAVISITPDAFSLTCIPILAPPTVMWKWIMPRGRSVGDRAITLMSSPTNPAFQTALQRYLDAWASDARSFTSEATPDDVPREVEEYENANRDTSSRRYIGIFSMLIQNFEGFFSAVDTFVSSNPLTAALVWGGFRFVIQAL